jgi:hypothetical protein
MSQQTKTLDFVAYVHNSSECRHYVSHANIANIARGIILDGDSSLLDPDQVNENPWSKRWQTNSGMLAAFISAIPVIRSACHRKLRPRHTTSFRQA